MGTVLCVKQHSTDAKEHRFGPDNGGARPYHQHDRASWVDEDECMRRMNAGIRWSLLLAVVGVLPVAAADSDLAFFESKIRPLLVEHCHSCHSVKAGKKKGGLLLDSRQAFLTGGDNGAAMVPGKPTESLLLNAVSYQDPDLEMPPKERLSPAQVADLTKWIQTGAAWPEEAAPKPDSTHHDGPVAIDSKVHWAWSPIRAVEPPKVQEKGWAQTPIDRFILAKLDEAKLKPAPEADRRALIRRAAFALTGLPPTIAEVDAFLADTSASAFERVVDRYLASPAFGERWARHWLDLVRYAETRGHEFDQRVPNAWQYRDYVILAFNADVPYDRFVQEHLAGDLLPEPRLTKDGADEGILATGFWYLGEMIHSPVDIRQDEADRIDNQIDVMGKTFMGLTIGCARCHDHKFDPITAKDYHALGGIIQSSSYRQVRFESDRHNRAVAERLWTLRQINDNSLRRTIETSLTPGIIAVEKILLAALEVDGSAGNGLPEVAQRHALHLPTFAAWLKHLQTVADDPRDPFHAWARLMRAPRDKRAESLAAVQREVADKQKHDQEGWNQSLSDSTILVDYARPNEPFLPDGVAFGPAVAQRGTLRFGADPEKPVLRFNDRTAAWFDPLWQRLTSGPDSVTDPADLNFSRAGRTLRTRTIDLTEGPVHVLLRGKGMLYAAVGAHTQVDGPLHRALVRKVDGKVGEWRWERMDLQAYPGHRCHIEFTADSDDFAVAMVVQGKHTPPVPPFVAPAPFEQTATTIEQFAGFHRAAFTVAFGDKPPKPAQDALLAWALAHPELMGAIDPAVIGDFAKDQAAIAKDIRDKSRMALGIMDGNGADWRILIRGSPRNPGPVAPRGLPESVFGKQPAITQGSGRLDIAQRMTDPKSNPFVARVMANRIWHHLMGRGIVASVDNFGALGTPPTHPELLDYLATRFVADGWSMKRLARSIMLSATWRMSSAADPGQDAKDPGNLLLHRANLHRLEGEAIRDALLAMSGRLDPKLYGPSIPIHLSDFMTGRGRPNGGPLDGHGRRSIYQTVWRNFLSPMMLAFDTPIPFNTMGKRASSNVPAQALILMNDPFVQQQAELWAKKVGEQVPETPARISLLYRMAFAREPLPAEVAAAQEFLGDKPDAKSWSDLAHALVTTKEFIFVQ
jgi:mono/diheme cytochrome c family protein